MAISSRAIKAGEAFVSMMLDDKQFSDSIDQWKERFSQLEKRVAPLGQALAGVGATLSTPFALGFRHLLTYTKQLDFTADRLGLTADEMARLAAIAQMTDVSVEGLEIGMKTIGERIMQLQSSSQETAMAFQQLGINAQQFINEPNTLRRLFMISDAFTKIEDAGLQAGLSLRALGESGNRMLILLRKGPAQLQQEMAGFADIVADESQMRAARELFQGWGRLKLAAGNLAGELAETLVPVAVKLLTTLTDWAARITALVKTFPALSAAIGTMAFTAGALGTALLSLKAVSFLTFQTMGALKGAVDLVTISFSRLVPMLVTTELHLSGVGVAATGLTKAMGMLGLAFLAFTIPMKALSGESSILANFTQYIDGMQASVWRLVAAFEALPQSVRNFARVQEILANQRIYESITGSPELVRAGEFGIKMQPLATSPSTSGIAARFASQQTLGASGGTTAATQTANNTSRMADTLDRMEVRQREAGRL